MGYNAAGTAGVAARHQEYHMAESNRTHELRVRLTEGEHQQVRQAASICNLPMAIWARQLILVAAGRAIESDLAETLDTCTDPGHPAYDPEFTAKLRKIRPDWFDKPDTTRK